jgi:hypothetical protein
MKSLNIAFSLLICAMIAGCCGVYGSYPEYVVTHVTVQPFQPLQVTVGDTLSFYPEDFMYLDYKYVDASDACSGGDHTQSPSFSARLVADSLARPYHDIEGMSRWGVSRYWKGYRQKIRFVGLKSGTTTLKLEARWSKPSNADAIEYERRYDIQFTVVNP